MAKQTVKPPTLPRRKGKGVEDKPPPDWAVRLQQLRAMHYDTAVEFAKKVGFSQQRYDNYEKGKRQPKIADWQKIKEELKVTVDRIMFGPADRQ